MPSLPKPEPRATMQARKRRAERQVLAAVREQVYARDGGCRVWRDGAVQPWADRPLCYGVLSLAHLPPYRRGQTRRQAPELRHDPRWCVILCQRHHAMEERYALRHEFLSEEMANGPMRWRTS